LFNYTAGEEFALGGTATSLRKEILVVPVFGIVSLVSLCIAAAIAQYLEACGASALQRRACHIVSLPMTNAAWKRAIGTAALPREYADFRAAGLLDGMLLRRTSASLLNLLLLSRKWPSDAPAYDAFVGSRIHLFESIFSTDFFRSYDDGQSVKALAHTLGLQSKLFASIYRHKIPGKAHSPRRDKALVPWPIEVAEDRSRSCRCSLAALIHHIALCADKLTPRQSKTSFAEAPTRILALPRHQADLLVCFSRVPALKDDMDSLADPDSQLQLLIYDVSNSISDHSPYFILSAITQKQDALESLRKVGGKELSVLIETLRSPYFSTGAPEEAVLDGLLRLLDDVHEGIQAIGY
jgi:hypothetical protein